MGMWITQELTVGWSVNKRLLLKWAKDHGAGSCGRHEDPVKEEERKKKLKKAEEYTDDQCMCVEYCWFKKEEAPPFGLNTDIRITDVRDEHDEEVGISLIGNTTCVSLADVMEIVNDEEIMAKARAFYKEVTGEEAGEVQIFCHAVYR